MASIQHVVVLMLENRSFDCMLGKLYPSDASFEGLTGLESNNFGSSRVPVWNTPGMNSATATIPTPDPGELFTDMNAQLFGRTGPNDVPPPMSGFVDNYMAQPDAGTSSPGAVMHYFTPEQVPVISALAKAFGVCDQWHASAPCQTWPNRFFAHTATARGFVNNSQFPIPFPAPSIFRRLSDCGKTWRVYFHDVPQSVMIEDILLEAPLHYRFFRQFLVDAENGALPNYSFIEPRYFSDFLVQEVPNDGHPPHDVTCGERLIAAVYNALRSSPNWNEVLLIITYDEHGGCFDHVSPPRAVSPDDCKQEGFAFDRYGVRVPTVLVSPYIPAGSKIRSYNGPLPRLGPPYPFDHTSIMATLRSLFGLGPPFTRRDGVSPNLLGALSLPVPRIDCPASVATSSAPASLTTLKRYARIPPNQLQRALGQMTASLSSGQAAGVTMGVVGNLPVADEIARIASSAAARVAEFLGL